jgi:hypothetical protein
MLAALVSYLSRRLPLRSLAEEVTPAANQKTLFEGGVAL